MDCNTFQNNEIDALYGELDAPASAAMAEHAATCRSCAARYARLRGTRGLVLSVVESVSDNFESRVMAAVDAGLAAKPAAPKVEPAAGGAKIFKFMSRPAFAVAATFVLVIGAGAVLMQTGMAKKMAPAASFDQAPAAAAGSMAAASPPPPAAAPGDLGGMAPSPTATAAMLAEEVAAVTAASGALALNDTPAAAPVVGATRSPARRPPSARPMAPEPPMAAAPESKPALAAKKPATGTDELTTAKNLVAAGKCSEALPRLEALKGQNPEAELYAARCIAKTGNCARFDTAAQRNAGTAIGKSATLEGAKCFQATGNVVAARQRLEAAKSEGSPEAAQALDAIDRRPAGGGPSGGHAAPKAASPAPASDSK